jgi:ABC-2 type transport system permease protein
MVTVLRWAADVLPVSYAVEALQSVAANPAVSTGFARDLAVLAGFAAASVLAASATLRRQTR